MITLFSDPVLLDSTALFSTVSPPFSSSRSLYFTRHCSWLFHLFSLALAHPLPRPSWLLLSAWWKRIVNTAVDGWHYNRGIFFSKWKTSVFGTNCAKNLSEWFSFYFRPENCRLSKSTISCRRDIALLSSPRFPRFWLNLIPYIKTFQNQEMRKEKLLILLCSYYSWTSRCDHLPSATSFSKILKVFKWNHYTFWNLVLATISCKRLLPHLELNL